VKKLLVTLSLVAMTSLCHAEGTIQFANSVLTKVRMETLAGESFVAPTDIPIHYGVFFGADAESLSTSPDSPLGITHPTLPGIIATANVFHLTGTQSGQTVFLQICGWSAEFGTDWQTASISDGAWFGETGILPVRLGPDEGPAEVIWTNIPQPSDPPRPDRLMSLVLHTVPEPSTLALGALGGMALLFGRRIVRRSF